MRTLSRVQAVQVRRRPPKAIVPVSLRQEYVERGEYSAKFIIDGNLSQSLESVDVKLWNGDGKSMRFDAKRWGTKLTLSFTIDDTTPDGVSIIDITMHPRNSSPINERFDFWVIK